LETNNKIYGDATGISYVLYSKYDGIDLLGNEDLVKNNFNSWRVNNNFMILESDCLEICNSQSDD
jgi:hypothetical protein